ncbi:glycosyltransferase family 1 protein [Legionella sp. km772]|uniref:glycosyltransferase family 4 protein n=1 Tax=Legionella sp. km772 TaxID=2498111 RepID=UPI000F8F1019|nr:glycosyltransferase family 1 protein [Legionella sp. km772]RUR11669.1 glycosyltransferase family 1 protein [Legionella sp. km772]
MRLVLDVTRLMRRLLKKCALTGLDRVTQAYVEQYSSSAQALVRWSGMSYILPKAESQALFQWILQPDSRLSVLFLLVKGRLKKETFRSFKQGFLLNTGHIKLNAANYDQLIRKHQLKPIYFIHDLIPINYPEYCEPGEDQRHRVKMNYALATATGIITNSMATLEELRRYATQIQQKMPQATAALLGSSVANQALGRRPLNKPYYVILGTLEARKNHLLLLHIWRKLQQRLGVRAPHLFVIGQRGWECEQVVDMLDRCPALKEVVTEVPYCLDAELSHYLTHSQALLFPSFTEGYGLPLIEALSLGVPVLASDLAVFREIACDIPEYLDPLDAVSWESLILAYAHPESRERTAQLNRLSRFKPPTWPEHFAQVNLFLSKLSGANESSTFK